MNKPTFQKADQVSGNMWILLFWAGPSFKDCASVDARESLFCSNTFTKFYESDDHKMILLIVFHNFISRQKLISLASMYIIAGLYC